MGLFGALSFAITTAVMLQGPTDSLSLVVSYLLYAEPIFTLAAALLLWGRSRLAIVAIGLAIAFQLGTIVVRHPEVLQATESIAERLFLTMPPVYFAKAVVSILVFVYALFAIKRGELQ